MRSRLPACLASGSKLSRLSYIHPKVLSSDGEIIGRRVPGEITTSGTSQATARSITDLMCSMLLRRMLAPGLARLMSYPPAFSDRIVAPHPSSLALVAERSESEISSGQQCGELTGTSKVVYPLSTSSVIASIAVVDHR